MKIQERVAWNVRRLRLAVGIPQDELARLAELDAGYIGHIERGKRNLTLTTLNKISDALNTDVSELLAIPPADAHPCTPLKRGRKKIISE